MKTKIKYKFIKNYILKQMEMNYYRNQMIDIQILKKYIDLIIIYKRE